MNLSRKPLEISLPGYNTEKTPRTFAVETRRPRQPLLQGTII